MKLLGYEKLEQIEQDNPAYKASVAYLLEQSFSKPAKNPEYVQEDEINEWLNSLLAWKDR
jgi:hypothetical protein